MEITLSVDEESALTLYEELERTDTLNTMNLNVDCCCGLMRSSPFHQPKSSKSSSRERLRAGDSGVSSEDDDDADDHCSSPSSPECHGTECDHGAEGGGHSSHDHFHLRATAGSSTADFRSKSSASQRNDRYKCFGLLESNILNSFQLQNFRRKNGSEYDSANSSGQTSYSSTASSMIEDIADKIDEIGKLDTNIHSLMYKSVEVHKDIVSLEATTNRLIADTRKLSDDLEDVRYLDDLITILNGDIGPVIHREWPYQILFDTPIEEGTPVT